jgi:tetratricopeptide (TPR) repeat protein
MFQDDPTSKIFAPLAESYRKIGLVDEAIGICKEGLVSNPDFLGGKVALARAYFDKKMHVQVRELLSPVIDKIPDNLVAQRLLADSALTLGYVREALTSYKMLLYFNPNDHDVAGIVQELETQSYEGGGLLRVDQKPAKLRKLMRLQKLLNKVQQIRGQIIP